MHDNDGDDDGGDDGDDDGDNNGNNDGEGHDYDDSGCGVDNLSDCNCKVGISSCLM